MPDLRAIVAQWRGTGHRVGLIPTMGALHPGHGALVEAAAKIADRVVVTIFVNPTQFAPNEDFASYPRAFEDDCAFAEAAGAALIYAPDVVTMYPPGFATRLEVGGPASVGLEDKFRPTHFAGVATVVTKLLLQALPDIALFGEKDFQQLRVIEQTVRDLDVPVRVGGIPTIREADGLALSSRNRYLDPAERARAPMLHAALAACAAAGATEESLCAAREHLTAAGFAIDYVEAREAHTLAPPTNSGEQLRLLAAARLGRTRLIDNIAVR